MGVHFVPVGSEHSVDNDFAIAIEGHKRADEILVASKGPDMGIAAMG